MLKNTLDAAEQAEQVVHLISTLNPIQRDIFNEIVEIAHDSLAPSRFFFIDGPGGYGKTYLYNTLMCFFRGEQKSILAFQQPEFRQISWLEEEQCTVDLKFLFRRMKHRFPGSMTVPSLEANRIKEAAALIIDEASMPSTHSLRVIDLLLREITNDDRPFGGKLLILGGDFRQTSNIVPRGTVTEIIELCIKNSPLWRHVKHRSLITNMRSAGLCEFNDWVLRLGDGELNNFLPEMNSSIIEIPHYMVADGQIIESIFGTEIRVCTPYEIAVASRSVILTPKNDVTTELNHSILNLLPGNEVVYLSIRAGEVEEGDLPCVVVNGLKSRREG